MKKLDKAYTAELSARQKRVNTFIDFSDKLLEYEQLIGSIIALKGATPHFGADNSFCLIMQVGAMTEATPVLELIQEFTGCEFDKTSDYASDWITMRTFSMTGCPWFTVTASVKSDAKGCRSVPDGFETVPKFRIECDGEA